jgi:Helix-turn-helix domain
MTAEFYSVKDVARLLSIRVRSVLSLIDLDELKAVDVSIRQNQRPRWRIARIDLDGFIARRKRQAAAPRRRRRKPALATKVYF